MGESQQQRRSMNGYTVVATGLGDENGHPVDHREPPAQTTHVAGKQACRPKPFAGEHLATPDGTRTVIPVPSISLRMESRSRLLLSSICWCMRGSKRSAGSVRTPFDRSSGAEVQAAAPRTRRLALLISGFREPRESDGCPSDHPRQACLRKQGHRRESLGKR